MKNKSKFSVIFFLGFLISNAQDIIYKNDKTEVKSKIIEVQENEIKYKKFEFLDGPTYTMSKSMIYMIVYKNGQKEIFEAKKPVEVASTKTDNNSTSTVSSVKTSENKNAESSQYTIKKNSFGAIDLAVSLKNFSDYDIPYFFFSCDAIVRDNIAFQAFSSGSSASFESSTFGTNIKSSSFVSTFGIGGKYYFNEVLKIDPQKYHVYAGFLVGLSLISTSVSSNSSFVPSTSESATDFGFFGQVGGRYLWGKRWGVKSELQFAEGGTNFLVGLSYRIKPNKNRIK